MNLSTREFFWLDIVSTSIVPTLRGKVRLKTLNLNQKRNNGLIEYIWTNFHIKGNDLSLESRIMSVAVTFTALTEDRPYRQ